MIVTIVSLPKVVLGSFVTKSIYIRSPYHVRMARVESSPAVFWLVDFIRRQVLYLLIHFLTDSVICSQ